MKSLQSGVSKVCAPLHSENFFWGPMYREIMLSEKPEYFRLLKGEFGVASEPGAKN